MVRKVRWTHRALGRLDEIADYIAKDNPERAKTFVIELRDKVKILHLHKNYVAVCRIKDEEVHILTVLHSAQNR